MIVVIGHLVGLYWSGRDLVATATATPLLIGPPSVLLPLVTHEWFNFGAFGVAIFFLISGLVIPISLRHYDSSTFLLARILRIYPTYLVGFALLMAAISVNSVVWGRPFPAQWSDIAWNAALMTDFTTGPDLSLVSWTLCVEIKFYIIMAIFASGIRMGSVSVLFAISLGLLLINAAGTAPALVGLTQAWPYTYRAAILGDSYVAFMLIGILFNYHLHRFISTPKFLAGIVGLLLIFVATWRTSPFSNQYPMITANYFYALGVFMMFYLLRDHTPRSKLMDFLADISYPLYIIHSIVGYSILKFLMIGLDVSYGVSLAITLAVLIGSATLMHSSVESWSTTLAKTSLRRRVT